MAEIILNFAWIITIHPWTPSRTADVFSAQSDGPNTHNGREKR